MKTNALKILTGSCAMALGLAASLSAKQIEGEIVAAEESSATISVLTAEEVTKGDPVTLVIREEGNIYNTVHGAVTEIKEAAVVATFDSDDLPLNAVVTIDVRAPIHDADELTAIPLDTFAVTEGVRDEDLDIVSALEKCHAAIKAHPDEPRFYVQLGRILEVQKKPARATIEYEKALELQDRYPVALHNLGSIRFYGPAELRDNIVARSLFKKASELGHEASIPVLGSMCRDGMGGPEDLVSAAKWFKVGADNGNPYSQFALGECYEKGWGVQKDVGEALLLYRSAAEMELPQAMRNLGKAFAEGVGVERNDAAAFKWYSNAAAKKDAAAQYAVGTFYRNGRFVEKDVKTALDWFNKSALNGYTEANRAIAEAFYRGVGVAQDYDIAAAWYLRAAKEGDIHSQFNVGVMYEKGWGVSRSRSQAIGWYREAARLGHSPSQQRLIKLKKDW